MEEQERRIEAIRRYLQGEEISVICRALGRSRRWGGWPCPENQRSQE